MMNIDMLAGNARGVFNENIKKDKASKFAGGVYWGAMLILVGAVGLLLSALAFYINGNFSIDALIAFLGISERPWYFWLIQGGFTVIEVVGLIVVFNSELRAQFPLFVPIWLFVTLFDIVTTVFGTVQWYAEHSGLKSWPTPALWFIGCVTGVALAYFPEPALRLFGGFCWFGLKSVFGGGKPAREDDY